MKELANYYGSHNFISFTENIHVYTVLARVASGTPEIYYIAMGL